MGKNNERLKYKLLLKVLKSHKPDNPIQSEDLEEILGCAGATIRLMIRGLRQGTYDGIAHPIANTLLRNGQSEKVYFYASSLKDLLPTLTDLKSRCLSMFKSISKMESYCFEDSLQTQIPFIEELKSVKKEQMN